MKNLLILLFVFSLFCISSCILPKKFNDLQTEKNAADDKNNRLEQEIAAARKIGEKKDSTIRAKKHRIQHLNDTINILKEDILSLSTKYDNLMQTHEAMQKGSQEEMRKVLSMIQQGQLKLQQKEDELYELERVLAERQIAIKELAGELSERNERVIAMERALRQKDSISNALKQKLSDALLNFEGKGLTVKMHNGKVYVSMDDKLMFTSGSSDVDKRGAEAIKQIGQVLAINPDINVVIEGHTDDVPFLGKGQLLDNWDLSCKRATAVVRLLLKDSNIEQSRITAAGRAEYMPIKQGKTEEIRQANRRIEIILSPKLDEVLKMLEQ
ncbi:MAG: OmpA family protein [Bacteroidales bacterium]